MPCILAALFSQDSVTVASFWASHTSAGWQPGCAFANREEGTTIPATQGYKCKVNLSFAALLQGDVSVEIQSPVFSVTRYLLPIGEVTLPALIRGIEMKNFAYRAWYTQCKTILWVIKIKHTIEEITLIKWVSKTSNKYTKFYKLI